MRSLPDLQDLFPAPNRTIVCPCEDVTRGEIEDALARGFTTLEEVKRANGVATGPCQGRMCLLPTIEMLCRATGKSIAEVGTITHRPSTVPIPLGLLAGERWEEGK